MKAAETQESNILLKADFPFHSWYRFVLSYPPHLVRKYAEEFDLGPSDLLFDPFCGTGTTLVEGKILGIPSLGSEAHPFTAMVSRVKCNWSLNPGQMRKPERSNQWSLGSFCLSKYPDPALAAINGSGRMTGSNGDLRLCFAPSADYFRIADNTPTIQLSG